MSHTEAVRIYYRGIPRPKFLPICVCGANVWPHEPLVTLRQGSYAHEGCARRRGYRPQDTEKEI